MDLPQGFDLRALHIFTLVVETGGMTAAARRLGMTQSSVSQAVANLEAALGVTLFDRAVRPVALTAAGNIVYDKSRALTATAGDMLHAVRAAERQALSSLTIGMAESFANTVGPILVQELGYLTQRWRIWSGISPEHQAALLSRAVDAIVTTSDELDAVEGLERHPLIRESFVLAFPRSYQGPVDTLQELGRMPFVRYSLRSAIGRQIERQLNRLRLDFPIRAEFDTATSQLAAVADGLGWSMTTPMCLLQERRIIDRLRVEPLRRGRFSREATLIARKGDLGDATRLLADTARRILAERCFPELFAVHPWLEREIVWLAAEGAEARRAAP